MPNPPLSRRPRRRAAALPFLGPLALARGRAHEFCGPARRTLALIAARGTQGPVIWIAPAWQPARLHPEAVLGFIEPGRLVFVSPARGADLLWCCEEALRSGAAALVVADLAEPPGLTPVRRLHLAAEAGAAQGPAAPAGLILTPEGAAQGAESRWHLAPRHAAETERWHLARRHARAEPPRAWLLERAGGEFRLREAAQAPRRERTEALQEA